MKPRRDQPDDGEIYRLRREVRPPPLPESHRPEKSASKPDPHPVRKLLLGKLPLETETSLYVLVNLLDFFVTYFLLRTPASGNQRFVESNPVALYFIHAWGPVKGMLGFKLAIMTIVCVLSQIIALKRLDLGRLVLLFGTVATGAVAVYGVLLGLRHT
jgi:hypothetical protein